MPRVALTLIVLMALAAGVAGAQDAVQPTFSKDRRGDSDGADIVRVALARTDRDRLRAELTLADAWDTEDLRQGAAPASLCLRIFTRRVTDADPPDYLVCATAAAAGDGLVGRVYRDRANGLPRVVGDAAVSRPTSRTVYLRFAIDDVGEPARIRFSGEAISRGQGCRAPLGCRDLAPDAPSAVDLPLRSTTDHR